MGQSLHLFSGVRYQGCIRDSVSYLALYDPNIFLTYEFSLNILLDYCPILVQCWMPSVIGSNKMFNVRHCYLSYFCVIRDAFGFLTQ